MVKNKRGFSMLELMMVVTILSIVFVMGYSLMINTNRSFILNRAKIELDREARTAISIMTRQLRQAAPASIQITCPAGQPYYSKVTFNKIQGTAITYAQSGKTLSQTVGGVTSILSKNLRYVSFYFPRSDDMGIVSISLTLEKPIYEGKTRALHMTSEKVRVMN